MVGPLYGFGGVGPLSFNPLGPFGALSLGVNNFVSNFAMANPALSLIAQGYGTGRTYSPFGFSGMYGSYGLGASVLGGVFFGGPGPFNPMVMGMFAWMYDTTFGQRNQPQTQAGGPSQSAAPQSPPSAAAAAAPAEQAQTPAPGTAAKRPRSRRARASRPTEDQVMAYIGKKTGEGKPLTDEEKKFVEEYKKRHP